MFSFSHSYIKDGAWPQRMNVFASHILEFRTWADLADTFVKTMSTLKRGIVIHMYDFLHHVPKVFQKVAMR